MVSQLEALQVTVHLSTAATPELIAQEHYDAVIAGCGATPNFPELPGVQEAGVIPPVAVFGQEEHIGPRVVVIGGSSTGMETAVHLARMGKKVTLLTRKERAGYDLVGHSERIVRELVEQQPGLTVITRATLEALQPGCVQYRCSDGSVHTCTCDSIVFSGGKRPNTDAAFQFAGLSLQFFHIGDCNVENNEFYKTHEMVPGPAATPSGDIRHATFTGYMAAIRI